MEQVSNLIQVKRGANSIENASSTVLDKVGLIYSSDFAFAVGKDKNSRKIVWIEN